METIHVGDLCCFMPLRIFRLTLREGGPEWKDPKLEELLQQRMPKTYSSYLDTMESMLETIQALDDALGTGKMHFQGRVSITGEYVSLPERRPSSRFPLPPLSRETLTRSVFTETEVWDVRWPN
jgi:hypothetical protein